MEGVLEKIMVENFPNLGKEIHIQIQEAQRSPFNINKNRQTPQHILGKLANFRGKEKILKAAQDMPEETGMIYSGC